RSSRPLREDVTNPIHRLLKANVKRRVLGHRRRNLKELFECGSIELLKLRRILFNIRPSSHWSAVNTSNENKMSDGGRGRALLGVKVWKSSQKCSARRSAVRSIAWLGLCGFIGGRGATIGAQLHNKFFAIIAIAHILSCKLESAFL